MQYTGSISVVFAALADVWLKALNQRSPLHQWTLAHGMDDYFA